MVDCPAPNGRPLKKAAIYMVKAIHTNWRKRSPAWAGGALDQLLRHQHDNATVPLEGLPTRIEGAVQVVRRCGAQSLDSEPSNVATFALLVFCNRAMRA